MKQSWNSSFLTFLLQYDKTECQILLLLVPSSPVLVLRIKKKKNSSLVVTEINS